METQTPKPELTAEEIEAKAVAIEKRFMEYVTDGKLVVEESPEGLKYIVARFTHDKEEAVGIVERLDMIHHFDRIKQICFVNGMLDGITTYLRQIRALNKPLGMEKPIKIGTYLLDYLNTQKGAL